MKRALACLLFVGLTAVCLPWSMPAARAFEEPLVVVVGQSFPHSDISLTLLKSIFRGQRVEIAGITMTPFNQPPGSPLRVAMDRIMLGLDPDAVATFWMDMRIRDQGAPPRTVSSEALALRVVAAFEGAITYSTPSALPPYVKALTVDGKSAADGGYPLKR